MSKLLYVISSPRGERSESRAIADQFLQAYQRPDPTVDVDALDLWHDPLPVYGGPGVAAKTAAVPMWNHSTPWVLKHLIDTISQPGIVFGFDPETGYTGLLAGKHAVVVYTGAV